MIQTYGLMDSRAIRIDLISNLIRYCARLAVARLARLRNSSS